KSVNGSRVLVLGVAYKRNIDDQRESPALEVIHLLRQRGAKVSYNDPYVPAAAGLKSVKLTPALLRAQDCVVIATDHTDYDFAQVVALARLVVDTRNATKNVKRGRAKIVLL
ncbi:MAG TPA: UDP binding domain-containing protein, partial [bacterium]|nr:UDP binding domain-containing protein [bacterium]